MSIILNTGLRLEKKGYKSISMCYFACKYTAVDNECELK